MIKILHTGDVHLDAPFSSLDPTLASQRRNELRAAFTSMMTYAKMMSVDLILIAGDLIDGSMATRETVAMLCREFENFAKPVFIAPGNHDPASVKSIWTKSIFPKNVHVFTSETVSAVDLDELGVTVYGYAFTDRELNHAPIDGMTVSDPSRINLLVGHCELIGAKTEKPGSPHTYCPVSESHLLSFGADYSALGHIHNPPVPHPEGKWSWCGCLEGRGFDECGPKGACIAEITKKDGISKVSLKRVRFSKKRYEKGEVSVNGANTLADITEAILSYIRERKYGEDTILSLTLSGCISPSLMPDTDILEKSITGIANISITDATRPDLDFESLANDITVRGEVYRQLKPSLESDDERTREVGLRALRYAFSALEGDRII